MKLLQNPYIWQSNTRNIHETRQMLVNQKEMGYDEGNVIVYLHL